MTADNTHVIGKSTNKGSSTVEAAIIFPVILLCVLAFVYTSLLLYRYALIRSVADSAAVMGASTWNNPRRTVETGAVNKESLGAGGLYWRLYDKDSNTKRDNIQKYALKKLGMASNSGSAGKTKGEIRVSVIDYIVYKKLQVDITVRYEIPGGGLLKLFGMDRYYSVRACSRAVISEPAEFIRNTDFLVDLEKELEQNSAGLKKLGDSVRGIIGKVQNGAGKLMDGSGDGASQ